MADWSLYQDEEPSSGAKALVGVFFVPTTLLMAYSIAKLVNVFRAVVTTRIYTDKPKHGGKIREGTEPIVTIQICAFNEASVIKATIDAACSVDWPKDKLVVQVLDDSTDETSNIIEIAAEKWREEGISCRRLTRLDRIGYKAGALAHNANHMAGEFVALFDADHRCEPQYLKRAVPHFFNDDGTAKEQIGLVQVPWAYYNTHQSLLTEYDALALDISHVIEQQGRSMLQCFGFNGTGGIWRVAAIEAGGGWQWDTITEDLDLSYLAHLQGYKFVYLRDIPQQLELPAGFVAHKQQKHRWTKGFFQVARKSLSDIICSPLSPLSIKIEAFFHMTSSVSYLLTMWVLIMAPIIHYYDCFSNFLIVYVSLPALAPIVSSIVAIYAKVPGSNGHYATFWSRTMRLVYVPVLLTFSMGMSVYETYAMIDGLTSNDATFLRTTKEGKTEADSGDPDEIFYEDYDSIEQVSDNAMCDEADVSKKSKKKRNDLFIEMFLIGIGMSIACYLTTAVFLDLFVWKKSETVLAKVVTSIFLLPAVGLFIFHGFVLKSVVKKHTQKKAIPVDIASTSPLLNTAAPCESTCA